MNPTAARAVPRTERVLREQRAATLGASTPRHLHLVANAIEDEGIVELPGVDADRLRLLAAELESDSRDIEITALREHGNTLHRALCEAIEDLDAARGATPVVFIFCQPRSVFEAMGGLTPAQFSDLAVYLLDEIE